jgi:hypothetical protein
MHQSPSHISSKLRRSVPRLLGSRRKSFTSEEVRQRLQVDAAADERTAMVHAAAAQTGIWSSHVSDRLAFDLGRTASRLPTVVYWFRQGIPSHEIGRRLSAFGGAWDADRALDAAAGLIAQALNRGDLAYLMA